jgi:hypothetical protein
MRALRRAHDIVTRDADGTRASLQQPYAKMDCKTSGGHDA